jgi:hypothetical protein
LIVEQSLAALNYRYGVITVAFGIFFSSAFILDLFDASGSDKLR